mgnify:CR=1 FL=1
MTDQFFRLEDALTLNDLDGLSIDGLATALVELDELRDKLRDHRDKLSQEIESRIPPGADAAVGDGWMVQRSMRLSRSVEPDALRRLRDEGELRPEDVNDAITIKQNERVDMRRFAKLARRYGDRVTALVREEYGAPSYSAVAFDKATGEIKES